MKITNHTIRSIASTLITSCFLILLGLILVRCNPQPAHALEPAPYDLNIQAGEDYTLEVSFMDNAGRVQDLTGYSHRAEARADYATPAFGQFSTVATSTKVTIKMNKRTTALLSGKRGVWDLQQTNPSGQVSYWLRGKIYFVPVVTR